MKNTDDISEEVKLDFTGERVVPNETPYNIFQEHIGRYIFSSKFVKNKTVLDIACGTGYGSNYLAREGAKNVFGGDISLDAIKFAKNNYKRDNLNFISVDALKLPYPDNFFDVIVSYETIEHIEQNELFLQSCNRTLKLDGLFICSTPNKKITSPNSEMPVNSFHVKEFYPSEFMELLGQYFTDVEFYGQNNKNLLKIRIFKLGAIFLKFMPWDNKIKNLILKIIQRKKILSNHHFSEDFENIAHENYKIKKFQDNLIVSPTFIIAVCKGAKK